MIESPQPDQPPGSFSERYRNVPYGPDAPTSTPASGSGRRIPVPRRLLIAGAIAIVIVLGALAAMQFLQPGSSAPSANAPRTSALPASIEPGKQVIAKFWSMVRNPVLSYHVAASGSWTGAAGSGSFTSSLDVAGDDYSGSISEKGAGKPVTARVIRKDPFTWTKAGTRPWLPLLTNDPAQRSLPFLYLDTQAALAYAGPVDRDGQHVHLLRSTDAYQPYVSGLLNLPGFELPKDVVQLELYVTDQGTPVAADFVCEAGGRRANGKPVFRGTAERIFSKFGAEYTIVAPGS
jgi:hypothetical protein